ncbi:hypothetical protein Ahy_A08g038552 [Arachis hypogaea]|uniref:Aminotransferase-like plant mobile domain-containing protein n=1 Tax=Arachis hypogaea TaxID=3818 RepID=A0A445BU37_ARAHY|nr:hypothetical protein Ahy_A08g038552 [Arachis hypogaea]
MKKKVVECLDNFACKSQSFMGTNICQRFQLSWVEIGALVNTLIERWHLDAHIFHLQVGEYVITLEDVAIILGLPINGLPVTGVTVSSFDTLEAECLDQFGVAPRKVDSRGSFIKLT